ncbi:MAG TPA: PAS domain-containing protein [Chitinophagaceae bacterium]|nr:PAS domain-containing protein [Chitinophagaceae bacterium]
MYRFQRLPGLAAFILEHHLEAYVREQVRLSRLYQVPLLKLLERQYSEEQIVAFSIASSGAFLKRLAANEGYEQLHESITSWLADQLEIVQQAEVAAEDITLVNHIRGQALKKWIPACEQDLTAALELAGEIDNLLLGAITTGTNTYIQLLKQRISEETYLSRKLIEASPAIIFLYDTQTGRELFVSGKVEEVMGFTPEELKAKGENVLAELTHPEDLPRLVAHLEEVQKDNSDRTYQIEYRFRHKDGSYRWLRTYETIFRRNEKGQVLEMLGSSFEITREKEIELALQKRESQLLEAQQLAHIGSYEWNILRNESVNTPEVYRIFELNADQRFEQFMDHVHPADKKRVEAALMEAFRTGDYACEYRYIKNNLEKVIWSVGKVTFRDGRPESMIGTVQDITAIRRMEKELSEKSEALERSNESLKQFASVASHDLKEPLRKISTFTDIVLEQEENRLTEYARIQLQKVQSSARRMLQMINDILAYSSGTMEAAQTVSLQSLLEECMDLLEQPIQEKGALILSDGLPEASVAPAQFRQLFLNLLSNALKFQKAGSPPEIQVTHRYCSHRDLAGIPLPYAARYLKICFSDNGIGFPPEYAEKIFGLFSRLHSQSAYEGTGLGLSICKRVAESHGGRITALAKASGGAEFQLIIPVE